MSYEYVGTPAEITPHSWCFASEFDEYSVDGDERGERTLLKRLGVRV